MEQFTESSNFTILIVEDDLSFSIELEMLVNQLGYNNVFQTDNSEEALSISRAIKPDLILMDIDINGQLNGLEVAELLLPLHIPILFLTSWADEALYRRARETNLVGYLVKPVNKYSIRAAIFVAMEKVKTTSSEEVIADEEEKDKFDADNLYFKKRGTYQKIPIEDVLYFQANGDYCIVFTLNHLKFSSTLRLKELEDLLLVKNFLKVHRSYLINMKHVKALDNKQNLIVFQNNAIPFSRRLKAKIIEKLPIV